MNCDTGHLVRDLEMVAMFDRQKYNQIPEQLTPYAEKALGENDEVMIPLKSSSKLATFAGETRRERRMTKSLFTRQQKFERRKSV